MSEQKWEVGPVKLVNGTDATIYQYCEKRRRYIGWWSAASGAVYAAEWTASGSHSMAGVGDPMLDLAPPPKKTMRFRGWLNVHSDGRFILWSDKFMADSVANRFACVEIDREVTEGEGLSETPN